MVTYGDEEGCAGGEAGSFDFGMGVNERRALAGYCGVRQCSMIDV